MYDAFSMSTFFVFFFARENFTSFFHSEYVVLKNVPEFKEAANVTLNVAIKGFYDTDCIENIVEKGEIARFEQFHLFTQCFLKLFSTVCQNEYIWRKGLR